MVGVENSKDELMEAPRGTRSQSPIGAPMKDVQALVVDDDHQIRLTVQAALRGHGFSTVFATTAEEGLAVTRGRRFEVVLLDLRLPGMQGLEMLENLRRLPHPPETVVVTGRPEPASAVEAMKLGAYDYLSKPFDVLKLVSTLKNAAAKCRLSRENTTLKHVVQQQEPYSRGPIIAASNEMKEVLSTVERIAPSDASVLIQGETGTGKGLTAKLIHNQSARTQAPHLHINCSALNDPLLESELFGHEKGSFTGATDAKLGLFEVADGGTLFLDEVGEMSPAMQAKLLQVLDDGELRRVGGTSVVKVDVRIVAATNKDLETEAAEGRFRKDLLFRLNVVNLHLPPLRQRKDDIPGLVGLYLERYRLPGQEVKTLTERAMAELCDYAWPGNVRELANVIEGMVLLAATDELDIDNLPPSLSASQSCPPEDEQAVPVSMAEIQRRHVIRTLRYTGGKKAPAARLLGIDIKTLSSKIRRYGIVL